MAYGVSEQVKDQWTRGFAQDQFEDRLNKWPNYIAQFNSGEQVHFVHAKSDATDAIPLIMLHGWPGQSRRM